MRWHRRPPALRCAPPSELREPFPKHSHARLHYRIMDRIDKCHLPPPAGPSDTRLHMSIASGSAGRHNLQACVISAGSRSNWLSSQRYSTITFRSSSGCKPRFSTPARAAKSMRRLRGWRTLFSSIQPTVRAQTKHCGATGSPQKGYSITLNVSSFAKAYPFAMKSHRGWTAKIAGGDMLMRRRELSGLDFRLFPST
jgi:hypothetical protein